MKRERHLKMFDGICFGMKKKPVTEQFGNGFTTHFTWDDGEVIQGCGWTKEESMQDFEDAICVKYEGWGL